VALLAVRVMITDVLMIVDWGTRHFLCASLPISFGEDVAEWLLRESP